MEDHLHRNVQSPANRLEEEPELAAHYQPPSRSLCPLVLGFGMSQMFAVAKLASVICKVNPEGSW